MCFEERERRGERREELFLESGGNLGGSGNLGLEPPPPNRPPFLVPSFRFQLVLVLVLRYFPLAARHLPVPHFLSLFSPLLFAYTLFGMHGTDKLPVACLLLHDVIVLN
jgi:hypothetical protein